MRSLLTILFYVAITTTACTIETSGNGDLDGFWHLTNVDTLATGGITDYSQKQVFWSFQGKMYKMRDFSTGIAVIGYFTRHDDSLFIANVYRDDRMYDDPPIKDVAELYVYGVDAINEHYSIVYLSSSRMTLKSTTLELEFKKQ